MQSAMNFLKRRLSESSFSGNVPNGYLVDFEEPRRPAATSQAPDSERSPKSSSNVTSSQTAGSPREDLQQNAAGSGFFSALKYVSVATTKMKTNAEQAASGFKNLLIIDDEHTDWKKYFVGRKVHDCYSLRVEQASFNELTLTASTANGVVVDIKCNQDGNHVIKTFKPHFVLVRQSPRSMAENADFRSIIIGLKFGGIPSVNSLHSIYNFLDRPWTFAQLIRIQKRLGFDKFPLISQTYFPSGKEMLTVPNYPVVVKIGHAHNGMGKLMVDNYHQFQDVSSVVAMTGTYAVAEPYVNSKFDIRVQKIGGTYRAYVRTSISNSWKANTGSAMLEEIPVSDSHRLWVDACSEMFGGLDIVAVKAVHGADGKDYIIEVSDCSVPLVGEKQDEDRKIISDLIIHKMSNIYRPRQSVDGHAETPKPAKRMIPAIKPVSQTAPRQYARLSSSSAPASPPSSPKRFDSVASSTDVSSFRNSAPPSPGSSRNSIPRELLTEDEGNAEKIRNLRKTFASIFTE